MPEANTVWLVLVFLAVIVAVSLGDHFKRDDIEDWIDEEDL